MRFPENIEKIFKEDIREKKKAGSGAFHMRGKGVKHGLSGALRTPYHFMKTREKNKLNGPVEVYNMYETIINWNEFMAKEEETQKLMLTRWRELYPNEKIMAELAEGRFSKFNSQSFSELVKKLGCPPKTRNIQPKRRKARTKPEPKESILEAALKNSPEQEQTMLMFESKQEETPIIVLNGLNLEYNGEYSPEQLTKIFTKLQLLVDGEENKFKLSVQLVEVG